MSAGRSQKLQTFATWSEAPELGQSTKDGYEQFNDDSDEYYGKVLSAPREERPVDMVTIQRAPPLNSEIPLAPEPQWKRGLNAAFAFVFPFPYALLYGSDGRWDARSILYLGQMFCCPAEVDPDALRPAMLVWSIISGFVWILVWAVSQSVFLAILAGYYFVSAVLLIGLWVKATFFKERRLIYESL